MLPLTCVSLSLSHTHLPALYFHSLIPSTSFDEFHKGEKEDKDRHSCHMEAGSSMRNGSTGNMEQVSKKYDLLAIPTHCTVRERLLALVISSANKWHLLRGGEVSH